MLRYGKKARHSFGSPGELKGMKLWTNEAGFRVPGIISWIGENKFSGTSDAVVSALDFLPTFCELAGVELPKRDLDGESFASLLESGNFERNKPLLWSFYDALNDQVVALRHGDWKIMCRLKNNGEYLPKIHNLYDGNESFVKEAKLTDFVLYDLKNDISESKDLSKKDIEQFTAMKELIEVEYKNLLEDSHIWIRDKTGH